jgi:hypothetical protein
MRKSAVITGIALLVALGFVWQLSTAGSGEAMVVSVSLDGKSAISSHRDGAIILWDIEGRRSDAISDASNIYSAHFSRYSNTFLWQDLNGEVCIEEYGATDSDADCFETEPVFGHVYIDPLGLHLYSDDHWRIVSGDGRKLKWDDQIRSFYGAGKLLNLEGSPSGDRLLSVGMPLSDGDKKPIDGQNPIDPEQRFSNFEGLVIWDLNRFEPIARMVGHNVKTHATFSPDGNYVVSVDENSKGFVWDAHSGERVTDLAVLGVGLYVGGHERGSPENWEKDGLRVRRGSPGFPDDFSNFGYVAVQFITNEHYLAFFYDQRYAALHKLGDPFALKMVDLGDRPFPSTGSYARNASIASAPEVGILVTGQQDGNGINVYQFDEETQEFEQIWAPRRRSWWPF